jgi:hypothetical protein
VITLTVEPNQYEERPWLIFYHFDTFCAREFIFCFISKFKRMDKADGHDGDKTELIKLEFLMDSDILAFK